MSCQRNILTCSHNYGTSLTYPCTDSTHHSCCTCLACTHGCGGQQDLFHKEVQVIGVKICNTINNPHNPRGESSPWSGMKHIIVPGTKSLNVLQCVSSSTQQEPALISKPHRHLSGREHPPYAFIITARAGNWLRF